MNAEIKAKWLEALRSGKYKQGKHYLRNEDETFCCLGVLCDLVDPDGWGELVEVALNRKAYLMGERSRAFPPKDITDAADIIPCGKLDFLSQLAHLNDSGATFAKIAEEIELHCDN